MRKWDLAAAALALSFVPVAAFAGHGKAGLWNVSTTMNMGNMQLPPEAAAKMKEMGMKMPSAQTFNAQICMTQAEVDADKPPPMGRSSGCTAHVTSQTGTSMTADMVCDGEMKGNGHMQVSYTSPEHYAGSYSFKGVAGGRPMETSSSFAGDWVKADCGSVKPRAP